MISNPYQVKVDAVPIQLDSKISLHQYLAANGVPIGYQLRSNPRSLECQSGMMPIEIQSYAFYSQSYANWLPIKFQLTAIQMPIEIQSDVFWLQTLCQLTANQIPIDCHSNTNWVSIDNLMPTNCKSEIEIKFKVTWVSIDCQLRYNPPSIQSNLIRQLFWDRVNPWPATGGFKPGWVPEKYL